MLQAEFMKEIEVVLQQGRNEFEELKSALSLDQWFKEPEKGWSAFQTLEHINISLDLYLDRMIKKASALNDADQGLIHYKPGWMGKLMVGMIKPQEDWKIKPIKTFKSFEGKSLGDEDELKAQFQRLGDHLNQFDELFKFLQDKDLNSKKINSAIGPIMRFSLGSALEFLSWHHLRHFRQISRVSGYEFKNPSYPTFK